MMEPIADQRSNMLRLFQNGLKPPTSPSNDAGTWKFHHAMISSPFVPSFFLSCFRIPYPLFIPYLCPIYPLFIPYYIHSLYLFNYPYLSPIYPFFIHYLYLFISIHLHPRNREERSGGGTHGTLAGEST